MAERPRPALITTVVVFCAVALVGFGLLLNLAYGVQDDRMGPQVAFWAWATAVLVVLTVAAWRRWHRSGKAIALSVVAACALGVGVNRLLWPSVYGQTARGCFPESSFCNWARASNDFFHDLGSTEPGEDPALMLRRAKDRAGLAGAGAGAAFATVAIVVGLRRSPARRVNTEVQPSA